MTNRTLYVKGFGNDWEVKDLTEIFRKFGTISNLVIKKCDWEQFTYGFVEFETHVSVWKALSINNIFVNNTWLLVLENLKMSGGVGTMTKEVYVEGFGTEVSDADLKRIIEEEGHMPLIVKIKAAS